MDAKGGDRLYYQTDSHWNYLGATVGYKALMARVEQALPGLTVAPGHAPALRPRRRTYYSGDLAQMLGLQRQFRETDIAPLGKILATPESRCAKLDAAADAPNVETYVYRCPNAPRFTALVYRDSMAIPLDSDAGGELFPHDVRDVGATRPCAGRAPGAGYRHRGDWSNARCSGLSAFPMPR